MSREGDEMLLAFRRFMFDRVYISPPLIPDRQRGYGVVQMLYDYYMKHPDKIPKERMELAEDTSEAVRDLIAGLTDNHAIALFDDIFVPRHWKV